MTNTNDIFINIISSMNAILHLITKRNRRKCTKLPRKMYLIDERSGSGLVYIWGTSFSCYTSSYFRWWRTILVRAFILLNVLPQLPKVHGYLIGKICIRICFQITNSKFKESIEELMLKMIFSVATIFGLIKTIGGRQNLIDIDVRWQVRFSIICKFVRLIWWLVYIKYALNALAI